MKIEQIGCNIKFQARYLPFDVCKNINILKSRMADDTVVLRGKDLNQVVYTRTLSINNGEAFFKDGRFLAKKDKNNKWIPYGPDTAMIEFDNIRVISNKNGEIIEHKKPFFKKWDTVIEQIDKYIKCAIENYSNDNIIKKISQK